MINEFKKIDSEEVDNSSSNTNKENEATSNNSQKNNEKNSDGVTEPKNFKVITSSEYEVMEIKRQLTEFYD